MNFQKNLFDSILWSHWCNWKCMWFSSDAANMWVSSPWLWALQIYSLCYSVNHRIVTLIIMHEQRALHHVMNSTLNPFYHWYSTFRIWILNNSVLQPTTELLHWAQWLCIMQRNSLLDCKNTCLFRNSWYSTGVSQSTTKLCVALNTMVLWWKLRMKTFLNTCFSLEKISKVTS